MARAAPLRTQTPTLSQVVTAYWAGRAKRDLPLNTQRAYRHAHQALLEAVGSDQPITVLSGETLREVLEQRWAGASPATWNARVAALQSLIAYSRRHGWLTDGSPTLERRRHLGGETRAIPYDDLAALWSRPDITLREQALWSMLYETAARAGEVLALDVEDLDLGRQRAIITGQGGRRETIVWGGATARLLAQYLAGRRRGPLFLTHRRPNVVPADVDRCPATGRARLSYERVWAIFHQASGGWTLHQLRHSALTHELEADLHL
jgi:integrase/recombinase XerC/integrase/recombinase XerD